MTEQEIQRRSKKRRQKRKQEMRKRKIKIMLIIALELLFILCALSYLIGRNAGSRRAQKQTQVIVNEDDMIYLNGPDEQSVSYVESDVQDTENGKGGYAGDKKGSNTGNKSTGNTKAEEEADIVLVNKDNRLPEDYNVTLKTLPDGVNKAAEEAYEPLCAMLKAGRKEGLSFEICSSYRSVERQQELFDEDLEALIRAGWSYQDAYKEVARETMPPGHSEHSTGLAFDIVSLGYQMLDEGQEHTAENKWLQEHCAEYGFILRYPKDKEEITKISYESWHFRYVGVEVAEYIMEEGITLEEYLEET